MATFGKVIGGGMPVGRLRRLAAHHGDLAPDGDTYQAGTLSGNPVAMAAGIATLDLLDDESVWEQLESSRCAAGRSCWRPCWRAHRFRCTWCGWVRCSGCRCTMASVRAAPSRSMRVRGKRFAATVPRHAGARHLSAAFGVRSVLPVAGASARMTCNASPPRSRPSLLDRSAEPHETTRVFQITVLLLVIVSAIQVG